MSYFQNIRLDNYRNFDNFEINFIPGCNVLFGKNGSGKTNILESISLFDKGLGFRKDSLQNLINNKDKQKKFNINSTFNHQDSLINLSIKTELVNEKLTKKLRVNDSSSKDSVKYFENLFSLILFLPEMERLFLNSPAIRRNFLDRLIYAVDKEYNKTINRYKKLIFERHKILKEQKYDIDWIESLENNIVELGLRIYKQRFEHIANINYCLRELDKLKKNYLKVSLSINDKFLNYEHDHLDDISSKYIDSLKTVRERDSFIGGCSIGPHKSDLVGHNLANNFDISQFSTGQQKTVILLIIIAQSNFLKFTVKRNPIILFDEVCSHLDDENRSLLLDLIEILNVQSFITGTDKNLFSFLSTKTSYCNID